MMVVEAGGAQGFFPPTGEEIVDMGISVQRIEPTVEEGRFIYHVAFYCGRISTNTPLVTGTYRTTIGILNPAEEETEVLWLVSSAGITSEESGFELGGLLDVAISCSDIRELFAAAGPEGSVQLGEFGTGYVILRALSQVVVTVAYALQTGG